MSSVFLNKLLLKSSGTSDTKCYIYVRSEWLEDTINIMLQDTRTHKFYSGQLKQSELLEAANDLEIPVSQFRAECEAVLTANIGLAGFEVELLHEEKTLLINKNEKFLMQYLEVKLNVVEKNFDLLETAIRLIEVNNHESENEKTNESIKEIMNSFHQCLEEKKQQKEYMLKKFTCLLSAKKAMIAKLNKQLVRLSEMNAMQVDTDQSDLSDNDIQHKRLKMLDKEKRSDECFKSGTQQIDVPQNVSRD